MSMTASAASAVPPHARAHRRVTSLHSLRIRPCCSIAHRAIAAWQNEQKKKINNEMANIVVVVWRNGVRVFIVGDNVNVTT